MKFNLTLFVTVLAFITTGLVKSREISLKNEALYGNTLKGVRSLLGPSLTNSLRRARRDTTDGVLEIKPAVENMVVQTDAEMDKMVQDLAALAENVISAADSYGANMAQGVQGLIFENGVPNMETQMGKMVGAAKDIIEKAAPSLNNVIGGLVVGTQATMQGAYSQTSGTGSKVVNNVLELIKLLYSNSKTQMAAMYMNMRSSMQTAYTQLDDMGSKIHDGINDIAVNGYDGMKNQIGGVASTMKSTVTDVYNLIGEPIGTSLNTMIDMVGTGMSDMQQYAQKTMDGTSNMMQQVYDDVTNQMSNAVDTISNRVEDMQNIVQMQMDNLNGAFMN